MKLIRISLYNSYIYLSYVYAIKQNESSEVLGTTEKAVKVLASSLEGKSSEPLIINRTNLCKN